LTLNRPQKYVNFYPFPRTKKKKPKTKN